MFNSKTINFLKEKIYLIFFSIFSFLFITPSIIYMVKNKTVLNFDNEFCFLLNDSNRLFQALVYIIIILGMIGIYYIIIKKRNRIFKNIKQLYIAISIISLIFVFTVPFWCSDVFYYLGVGRLESEYHQNPYYATMKDYVDDNNVNIEKDTVMLKGYNNYWSATTVVYGPIWTIICSIISKLSLGNIDFGLFIFKLCNVAVHLLNCYLIYKISNKKIFTIAYGLNPFILIEGIANVHNDMFVILFILIALYQILKKKNITLSVLSLAMATDIKYFAILLLPFIVIYFYKEKTISYRILKCIQYGAVFCIFMLIPYMLYINDMQVFKGMIDQQGKIAKGLYLFISQYFTEPSNLVDIVSKTMLYMFVIIYTYICAMLLVKPNIKFNIEMKKFFYILSAFIFLLITNFQPWYLIWLSPFIIWQKGKNMKLIIQMQLMTLIANIVFLIYSENFIYGVPFFVIFVTGTLICIIKNKKERIIYIKAENKGVEK